MIDIDELERLAKAVISGMPEVSEDDDKATDKQWFDSVRRYAEMVQASAMLPLIEELREYRHLCAKIREAYDTDTGYTDGMVYMCQEYSQYKNTQTVMADLIWNQPAGESADLRIGIRADMT